MADNVAITAGSGTTVATDNIGGVNYQRVKPNFGADGVAADADVGAGTGGAATQRVIIDSSQLSAVGNAASSSAGCVSIASDDAIVGSKTETAPATDTASSGLNGRLQRIAQRLTTSIARIFTEKWIAGSGAGLAWTTAFAASLFNALANGNAVLSGVSITNGTAFDMFADLNIEFASITTTAANGNYVGVYLYPLSATTGLYGDGKFGSAAAGPPPATYFVGSIVAPVGTQAVQGTLRGIVLPPGTFSFVLYNQLGVATSASASANTCTYRTYNRSVA